MVGGMVGRRVRGEVDIGDGWGMVGRRVQECEVRWR